MAASTKKEYHYVGHYAATLDSGQPIEPGEVVEMDKEGVEANKTMIEEGFLIEVGKEGGESK